MIELTDYNPADVAAVAQVLLDNLHTVEKDSGSVVATVSDAPQYVVNAMCAMHADMLPDDWRYERIYHTLAVITTLEKTSTDDDLERMQDETCEAGVDIANHKRAEWLASHSYRASYVDEARENGLIPEDADIWDQLHVGQYEESREIFSLALDEIAEILDTDDACYRYTAGWNTPGYLPDNEPVRFLTFEDARDYVDSLLGEHDDDENATDRQRDENAQARKNIVHLEDPFSYNVAGRVYWVAGNDFTIDDNEL